MATREEIREGIPFCDCGLTGGCEKCQPLIIDSSIKLITTPIDEIIKGALIDAGLFYLENRDGEKNTHEELERITKQLKQDLHSQGVVIKVHAVMAGQHMTDVYLVEPLIKEE